ncbi:ENR1 protein, partial [Panurus biarmicus]|nr:ENR1 protein [Panurus biarmicus]
VKESRLFWCNRSMGNPFQGVENLKKFWENLPDITTNWDTPEGMLWICGKRAYSRLPKDWRGTCTIGIIQPVFFLLPKTQDRTLRKPI